MNESDLMVEQLEISMEEAKSAIEDKNSLLRLADNPDFKKIIEQGYFINEASRLVLSKASPDMANDVNQKSIDNAIIAIGYLRKHFSALIGIGRQAEKALHDAEVARDEILAGAEDE